MFYFGGINGQYRIVIFYKSNLQELRKLECFGLPSKVCGLEPLPQKQSLRIRSTGAEQEMYAVLLHLTNAVI